ncbi:MAG: hypothetical protein WC489_02530 [Patescibacteria group bacterium]
MARFGAEGFTPKNVPPGPRTKRENLPACPHYSIIEVCAQLVGITPQTLANDPLFCGSDIKPIQNTGFDGVIEVPDTACLRVHERLHDMLHEVNQNATRPDSETLQRSLETWSSDAVTTSVIQQAYDSALAKAQAREDIIALWRNVVYDTFYIPEEYVNDAGKQEPHVAPVKCAEDLTEEQIVLKVRECEQALETQVTGLRKRKEKIHDGYIVPRKATHCPQTPIESQQGAYID